MTAYLTEVNGNEEKKKKKKEQKSCGTPLDLLTNVMMSLARSRAKSGVTKQDRPVRATPVSYWLGLLRSWEK